MKKSLLSEVRKMQKIAGLLKEEYRDTKDNLDIIKRCIELGNRQPKKWSDLKQAATEISREYVVSQDESKLDEAVEDLLDYYNPPQSVIPYEDVRDTGRGMFGMREYSEE